jgi:hypothetical protein
LPNRGFGDWRGGDRSREAVVVAAAAAAAGDEVVGGSGRTATASSSGAGLTGSNGAELEGPAARLGLKGHIPVQLFFPNKKLFFHMLRDG